MRRRAPCGEDSGNGDQDGDTGCDSGHDGDNGQIHTPILPVTDPVMPRKKRLSRQSPESLRVTLRQVVAALTR